MLNNLKNYFRIFSMNGKINLNVGQNNSEQDKTQENPKTHQNSTQNNKQQNKTNSYPKITSNQKKNNQKKTNNEKTIIEGKNENNKKSKINEKNEKKKTEDNSNTNEITDKSKETVVKTDQKNEKKNEMEKVVQTNLKKTDKKALTPFKEFDLSIEKKLNNKGYKELEPIGQGSYGKVFKAKSTKHREPVAVKAVDLKRLSDHFKRKYLSVEIELMKKMAEHKNVIKFYEVIEATDDHLLYIIMELCPNGDLCDYIFKRHYIPEREACLWFIQLINGVQHIHKSGYAHRDIKCENLLFDSNYNIKIVDFGFSSKIRYLENITQKEDKIITTKEELPSYTYCGSVIYSAPEVLLAQPYSPTMADIWSSGVVLYVMLFGHYPNDGSELEKFIENDEHYIEAPQFPEVSKECKELVKNILTDERNRYTIKDIKSSDWFKKKWEPIDNNISNKQYFENLNIQRVETLEFEYIPENGIQSVKSDNNSELKRLDI